MGLANGPEIRGRYREMIQRIEPDGKEELADATAKPDALVRDGEILFVYKSVNASLGTVRLEGSVRLPGLYALDKAGTLHDLLPAADVLAPTPYLLMGVIERIDPNTLQRSLIPFSLIHVLEGRENLPLISGDVVHVLTLDEMRTLAAARTQAAQNTAWAQSGNDFVAMPMPAETAAASAASSMPASAGAQAGNAAQSIGGLSAGDAAFFGRVLGDYRVTLEGRGAQQRQSYLVAPDTTLDEAVQAAGGLDTDADVSAVGSPAPTSTTRRASPPPCAKRSPCRPRDTRAWFCIRAT